MELNKNMGTVDRIVRITLALVLFGLIVTGTVSGVLAILMGVAAAIFAVTSVVSFCHCILHSNCLLAQSNFARFTLSHKVTGSECGHFVLPG